MLARNSNFPQLPCRIEVVEARVVTTKENTSVLLVFAAASVSIATATKIRLTTNNKKNNQEQRQQQQQVSSMSTEAEKEKDKWVQRAAAADGGRGLALEEYDPDDPDDMKLLYEALKEFNPNARKRLMAFIRSKRQKQADGEKRVHFLLRVLYLVRSFIVANRPSLIIGL